MQASAKRTWFGFDQVKLGLAALGLAGALAIGAVAVSTVGNDESSVAPSQTAAVTSRYAPRGSYFAEINQLPETSSAAVANTAWPAITHERMLYLEANLLPETAPVVRTDEVIRFWEANLLPSDGAGPYAELLTGKH